MRDKATFFFNNFPDSWDNGALWKMFSRYGKVIDVYVAFKRTKRDTRFGFVRFINIGDILSFESKLEGIMIGAEKLIINRAKFTKVGDKGVPVSEFPLIKPGSRPLPRVQFKGQTFKEAVAGSIARPSPRSNSVKSILLVEDEGLKAKLECCWVGKAKNYQVMQNAWDITKNNGLSDCKDENGDSYGRLTWLCFEGLPLVARNLTTIKAVVKDFVLMLVDDSFHACQSLNVIHKGKSYSIRVHEERLHAESMIFTPVSKVNTWDSGCNYNFIHNDDVESDNDNDSAFKDEFVGPSLVVENDGGQVGAHHSPSLEDKESSPVLSPIISTRVSQSGCVGTTKEIIDGTENVLFSIDQGGASSSMDQARYRQPNSSNVALSISNSFGPRSSNDNIGHAPDLNIRVDNGIIDAHEDNELNELLSSFHSFR
ncbi:nucleotide-binding alpha-beta plait domain-containing protein [Tanacetum coccineum]